MGFSLKSFIQQLKDIINTSNVFNVYSRLKECIESNEQYAKDCGQLK